MFTSLRLLVRQVCFLSVSALACVTVLGADAQSTAVTPTTAAILSPFQKRAISAFSPSGATFKGFSMTGTVKRTAGSLTENGTVQFQSSVDGSWTETWTGAGSNAVIKCSSWSSGHDCTIAVKGTTRQTDGLTNQRRAPWFAPWMGVSDLSLGNAAATENTDAQGDQVLSLSTPSAPVTDLAAGAQNELQQLVKNAAVSVLFDQATALPSGMHYLEPVTADTSNAIDVSIVYSDYRVEQGFLVPHHIQRYVQRTLESDIQINSVSLN